MIHDSRPGADLESDAHDNFTDRLGAMTPPNKPNERHPPSPGLPVFSTTSMNNVSAVYYDRIVAGLGIAEQLPAGWLMQVAYADERNIYTATHWATLELGRDYFRDQVSDAVESAVADNPERVDLIRDEFRSAGFRTGAGVEHYTPEHFFSNPPSWTFVVDLQLPIDNAAGRTLRQAYRRLGELGQSPEMEAQFENGLVVATGGITDLGGSFVFVHTDEEVGREFFEVTLPAKLEAALAEWPQPTHSVRRYPTHRLIVAPELIAGK